MKNGQLVTAYLDHCAAGRDFLDLEAAQAHIEKECQLWQSALDGGWTVAEMDAAFSRRFPALAERVRQIRVKKAAEQ